ncbi:UDP-Glycosyltransferase superfamily protein [Striga asiatica]|uniref:Glycosyltransferase n=1 Tax=Striga asiatica TaxID=4170 RepID=A0A5A7QKH8_STRAF|nr:UDP-Glycosyltransferase superfamily protein [Striga asiatica]
MVSLPNQLNFILIPLMAPGHIIPMIDMAKLLARHGITVSIIVTPLNAARFDSVVSRAISSGLPIRLLPVPFPAEEAGLPPGCESADSLPSYSLVPNFFDAVEKFRAPVDDTLAGLRPLPSCIICDKHLPWTADTCDRLRIPRIVFDGMSCFAQLVMHRLYASEIHTTVGPSEPFAVPNLPDKIELTRLQLPGYFNPGSVDVGSIRQRVKETEHRAHGVVANTFAELEGPYLDEYRKLKSGRVWCVGPLSLFGDDGPLDRAQRGNRASIDAGECIGWMDGQKPGSVVYACLGSLSRLSPAQFVELALGLELLGRPFILVVKGGDKSEEIEKWISESGFERRVFGERGLLIRGWAPQVLILSHSAVGGFLTHCGWNSTLEGVSAGVPMITWPIFAEQFLNEKLVVQVLRTGVGVGVKSVAHLGEETSPENEVGREDIRSAVERVMDVGREADERRERAKELGRKAKGAVEEGGSSSANVALLVQEITRLIDQQQ